jgi:hypothetical protein
LKDPEPEEWEELVSLVVETVVFSGLDNPEEEEAGKSRSPYYNEQRSHDLSSVNTMIRGAECKGYDSQDNKIGSASEI